LKIAVVGCGWSGVLLANSLSVSHEVSVYEKSKELKAICAWAIPTVLFRELAKSYSLNADDYIKWVSKQLIMELGKKTLHIPVTGLCTFDKFNFMKNMMGSTQATFHFGETLTPEKHNNYDLIVDATGCRAMLGQLSTDKYYSTYQVKAEFIDLPYPDFYIRFPSHEDLTATKYLWMNPLSYNTAYVGCSSTNGKKAYKIVHDFIQETHATVLEEQAKMLRLNPPQESRPFINGEIVGVGNSIGAITSFGEGNQTSADTVKLLAQNLTNLSQYQKQVLKHLGWLKYDYRAYAALTQNKILSNLTCMMKMQKIYYRRSHMKVNMQSLRKFFSGNKIAKQNPESN
jgi:flavin-dependent dehydrogenase